MQTENIDTMFIAALFAIAKNFKQPKCPSIGYWLTILLCLITDTWEDLDEPQRHYAE